MRAHHVRHHAEQRVQAVEVEIHAAAEQQRARPAAFVRHAVDVLADLLDLVALDRRGSARRARSPATCAAPRGSSTASPALSSTHSPDGCSSQQSLAADEMEARRRLGRKGMPQGSCISQRPYSTPSSLSPRNMSVSGSPVTGTLDEWSSMMVFLAWKLQAVTPYVALQPNVALRPMTEIRHDRTATGVIDADLDPAEDRRTSRAGMGGGRFAGARRVRAGDRGIPAGQPADAAGAAISASPKARPARR